MVVVHPVSSAVITKAVAIMGERAEEYLVSLSAPLSD
jgi:hypothetical protein